MSTLKEKIRKIPSSPGVYQFFDRDRKLIYIGKAASLKDRVGSYFSLSGKASRPIEQMITRVADVRTRKTETVLEAFFLEQELIKRHQPKYNVLGKDDKSSSYLCVTKEEFPRFEIARKTDLDKIASAPVFRKIYGPFSSKYSLATALKILRRIFPFHNRKEKSEKGCLSFQIGLCPGPFAGKITPKEYRKNIRSIEMILRGKKKALIRQIEKEMETAAKGEDFERAAEKRNQLFSLRHIRDVALISQKRSEGIRFSATSGKERSVDHSAAKKFRIEGFDISNISGQYLVGSMVVFGGSSDEIEPEKGQYRRFKIRTVVGSDDVASMAEVLRRRFDNDWPLPDLLLLDGGAGHLNMAVKVLEKQGKKIPILAVAKGPGRKKLDLRKFGPVPTISQRLIAQVRDEAHRFAISYHRQLRRKDAF